MENKSLSRVGVLIGFGLAFIAGSVTSGAFLRGSLVETGTCLSQALTEYIGAQNKHIKEHAGVIQSIVENLQVTVKASNGASIATDFSSVSARFQAEDKAFASKINAMSETYKIAQSRCQSTNVGGVTPMSTSSSMPTTQTSQSSRSSSSLSTTGLTSTSSSRSSTMSLTNMSSSQTSTMSPSSASSLHNSVSSLSSSSTYNLYNAGNDDPDDNTHGAASPLSSSQGTVPSSKVTQDQWLPY